MLKRFIQYLRAEEGAVTVDWVVLTAAVVALAAAAFGSIQSATGTVGSGVGGYLSTVQVGP